MGESLQMEGGTTFHFITDGFEPAMDQALAAAGEDDVLVAGGASVIRHYLAAGVIDEFWLSIVPPSARLRRASIGWHPG